jgi:hypothetical protein
MFFDAAAQLQDPQISARAAAARDELTASLRKAKEVLRTCSARSRTPEVRAPEAWLAPFHVSDHVS